MPSNIPSKSDVNGAAEFIKHQNLCDLDYYSHFSREELENKQRRYSAFIRGAEERCPCLDILVVHPLHFQAQRNAGRTSAPPQGNKHAQLRES